METVLFVKGYVRILGYTRERVGTCRGVWRDRLVSGVAVYYFRSVSSCFSCFSTAVVAALASEWMSIITKGCCCDIFHLLPLVTEGSRM